MEEDKIERVAAACGEVAGEHADFRAVGEWFGPAHRPVDGNGEEVCVVRSAVAGGGQSTFKRMLCTVCSQRVFWGVVAGSDYVASQSAKERIVWRPL